MTNRDRYLKDNVNLHEFARELASGLTGEDLYDIDTLNLSNKIVSVLSYDTDTLNEMEKEDLEYGINELTKQLQDREKIKDGLTSDRKRWWYSLQCRTMQMELCIRRPLKREELK